MPAYTNSIGAYQFLAMDGAFHLRQQQLELIERHGIDGTGLRRLGIRGKPFEVVTINYEVDFDTAEDKMDEYRELVGSDPVNVIRFSETEGDYFVLQVREQQAPAAILNSIGGIQPDPDNPVSLTCYHVVSWTLLAGA